VSSSTVLILAGATASGKTQLAIDLARQFDAEIVGADSRQIYRGMPIGTAAPSPEQLATVPHHLIGFLDPTERYSAARYASDALDAIDSIHERGKRAIVVGGTGFYIRALTGGIALAPQYDEAVRQRLAREAQLHEPAFLHAWLAQRDPARARALHASDTYRVLRALEVALADNQVVRQGPLRTLASDGLAVLLVFLDIPWAVIDRRIAERTKAIVEAGLVDEAERIGIDARTHKADARPKIGPTTTAKAISERDGVGRRGML
jgi:tRNA dimethylallyltransferase